MMMITVHMMLLLLTAIVLENLRPTRSHPNSEVKVPNSEVKMPNSEVKGISMVGIDSMGAGKGKVADKGASDVKGCLGDNPTIINIKFKQRQTMMEDSVVITTHSEDQGCYSFEFSDIGSKGGFKFRRGEELENDFFREVNVSLSKGQAVPAKVIIDCFKTRHNYFIFKLKSKVDPTEFGAYGAVKRLMVHCCKQPGITTEDKDTLGKGLKELEEKCLLSKLSDLFKFFPERVTLVAINVMQRAVDSIAWIREKPPGRLLMHFLVVLKFKGGICILVEKVKRPCSDSYVGIGRLVGSEGIRPRIHSIELDGVEVEVSKLVDLVKKFDTKYKFLTSNCWEFASGLSKELVKRLGDDVAADSADKGKLDHGLEKLIEVERPSPFSVVQFICTSSRLDHKNNETHRKLVNRCEPYLEKHPRSRVRRGVITRVLKLIEKTSDG